MSNDKNSLPFEKWEIELVRKKARRLTGKYGFSETDRHDLEQELLLHIFVRRSIEKYSGGSLIEQQEGLSRTLDNKLRKIKEYAKRDKRSVHTRQEAITEGYEESEGSESIPWIISEEEAKGEAGSILVNRDEGFEAALEAAMAKLTPLQQEIFRQRMAGYTAGEIAKNLKRTERTVFRQIMLLRRILKEEGFGG